MAYAWIQRNYGIDFRPGMRVRFIEDSGDRPVMGVGTVAKPGHGKDPHHVRVLFDGRSKPARCHPLSLVILEEEGP